MSRETLLLASVAGVLLIGLLGWSLLVRSLEERRHMSRRSRTGSRSGRDRDPTSRIERWFRGTRIGGAVADQLTSAGIAMRTIDFVVVNVLAFVVTRFVVERFLSTILAVPLALGAVGGIWLWVRYQRGQMMERFVGQLPEVARLLSNSASSGLGIVSSLELAAKELDDPAGREMGRLVQEMQIGRSLEGALQNLTKRVPSREIGVLVSTLVIQQRSGGNTVESLRGMAETLEKRKELNREVKTLIAESVFTAYAVAGMGIMLLVILNSLYPGVLDDMLRSGIGVTVLILSALLYTAGFLVIRRLSRLEA